MRIMIARSNGVQMERIGKMIDFSRCSFGEFVLFWRSGNSKQRNSNIGRLDCMMMMLSGHFVQQKNKDSLYRGCFPPMTMMAYGAFRIRFQVTLRPLSRFLLL